jgi:hypothetical protein
MVPSSCLIRHAAWLWNVGPTLYGWPHATPKPPADRLIKLAPTLASALVIITTMSRARSPWALPGVLVALPLAFHAALLWAGVTLADAQDAGWALKPEVGFCYGSSSFAPYDGCAQQTRSNSNMRTEFLMTGPRDVKPISCCASWSAAIGRAGKSAT